MKMESHISKIGTLTALIILLMVGTTSSAKDDTPIADTTHVDSVTPPAVVTSPMPEATVELPPETAGCERPSKLDRTQRLAVIAKIVIESESELEKDPGSLKNPAVRARLGTFAAGSMSDSVRFVSMDQRCWAHLYEAQTKLAAEDDVGAQSAAEAWQHCLEDLFPNRLEVAQPYFSCFISATPKKK